MVFEAFHPVITGLVGIIFHHPACMSFDHAVQKHLDADDPVIFAAVSGMRFRNAGDFPFRIFGVVGNDLVGVGPQFQFSLFFQLVAGFLFRKTKIIACKSGGGQTSCQSEILPCQNIGLQQIRIRKRINAASGIPVYSF